MNQIHWEATSQISTPNMHAQIRRYYWPEKYHVVRDRSEYWLSLCTARDLALMAAPAGKATAVATGTLGVLPPRLPVRIHMRAGWEQTTICMFQPAFFEEVTALDSFWYSEGLDACSNITSPGTIAAIEHIRHELENPGFATALVVESAGNIALVELARYVHTLRNQPQPPMQKAGLAPWQLKRINDRIAASLDLGVPALQELAQLCRISAYHMMRNYKVSTGTTLHKRIEQVRLESAKGMLAESHLSIKEIAGRLGFASAAYFATAFRRLTNMSPTEFRVTSACRWKSN